MSVGQGQHLQIRASLGFCQLLDDAIYLLANVGNVCEREDRDDLLQDQNRIVDVHEFAGLKTLDERLQGI